ncbi:MAG: zinc-dependent alcohol dehydrogenase family protein [Blastocatellales bacterium]|nr:zinc-dependent alcohol dehydrogenase family protein [Blastocatellales bacterium]
MIAAILRCPAPVESHPLEPAEIDIPAISGDQVLIRVAACGVCRTDLHVVEGELPQRKSPIIPGHQIVGRIEAVGPEVKRFAGGERVGAAWLHRTCGKCDYCQSGKENLCESADFTGWTVDGGYAEYAAAPADFVYQIPDGFADEQAAPLLCAGIIGFRSLRLSDIKPGGRLGLYGFGAAAHVAIQVARHWDIEVYAFTRDIRHRKLAMELGAAWTGAGEDAPPEKLDAAIIFAPAGELVVSALKTLKKGGVVACAGIHMSPIPPIDYQLLYHERVIRSVANNTREDGEMFLMTAAALPIETQIEVFPLSEANTALDALKNDAVRGAAVLRIGY